jgi:TRAP transporter 4TM/12TM fusion protein
VKGVRTGSLSYVLGAVLCLFTLAEVNYPLLSPQSQLAVFSGLGLVLCFLNWPLHRSLKPRAALTFVDVALALTAAACCAYVVVQTEPVFAKWWIGGQSLGNRAGQEAALDTAVGIVGLVIVVEAARRSIGWALPLLALAFLAYAGFGASLPDWLFPHRGYGVTRIVSQTFLHSQGVFGTALRVMFIYVFLFVVLGAILRRTGATQFIIDLARRLFGGSPGGPAKVSVLASGLMGSLSGSAVANTATTGTFTIPMMRSAGFKPEMAAGVEAAASSGGALVPPVMGAGAYMMLEIINPPVTYLQILRAALIPAVLYYLSLFLIVHFHSRKIGLTDRRPEETADDSEPRRFEGVIFLVGISGLVIALILGYSVFRAATVSIGLVIVTSAFRRRTRVSLREGLDSLARASKDMVPLIAAAACVGIVIGVVTLTGVGTKLPTRILDLSEGNLVSALILIMVSSIVLGMGLPSSVCYLLMATLVGPVLGQLGIVPLSAHLFIFYFGMMSMVTPPVALAAYTAGSMAGASIMRTGFAAFRLALVGFTLPYMFVFRPELLMLSPDGEAATIGGVLAATAAAVIGVVPFAAAIAGHLFHPLSPLLRAILLLTSLLLLFPAPIAGSPWILDAIAAAAVVTIALINHRTGTR